MIKNLQKPQGFTLIETIITLIVLTIVMTGATTFFLNFINNQIRSIGYLEAIEENMIERNVIGSKIKQAENLSIIYPATQPTPESQFHQLLIRNDDSNATAGPYSLVTTTEIPDEKIENETRTVIATKDFYPFNDLAYDEASKKVFYTDTGNHVVRTVDLSTGRIEIIAGTEGQMGAGENLLHSPAGIAVKDGKIYISDTGNHRIVEIDAGGNIRTIAGNGSVGYSEENSVATETPLHSPLGLAVDSEGSVIFADSGNHRIRKINLEGTIETLAGKGYPTTNDQRVGQINEYLFYPSDIAIDTNERNIYATDSYNSRVVKVNEDKTVQTIAGSVIRAFGGDDGFATNSFLNVPTGLTYHNNRLIVADSLNHVIREIDSGRDTVLGTEDDHIRTIVGYTARLFVHPGKDKTTDTDDVYTHTIPPRAGFLQGTDGTGSEARSASTRLNTPTGLTVDEDGNVFFADSLNNQIRFFMNVDTPIRAADQVSTKKGSVYTLVRNRSGVVTLRSIDLYALSFDEVGDYVGDTDINRFRFERLDNNFQHPAIKMDIEAAYLDPRSDTPIYSQLNTTVSLRSYKE